MCDMQANDEMALLPLRTCGCCWHRNTHAMGPQHQQLSGIHGHVKCPKVMGNLLDPVLSQGAGHHLLARGVIWSGKGIGDVGSGDRLAASLLEIQALGGALQTFPGS